MSFTNDEKETIIILRKAYAANAGHLHGEVETMFIDSEVNQKKMLKGFAVKVINGLEQDRANLELSLNETIRRLALLKRVRDG